MNHPVVSLAVLRSAGLHEAVVAREVVSDAVPPTRSLLAVEVRVIARDVVVNRAEGHAFAGSAEDGLRDDRDECFHMSTVLFRTRFLRRVLARRELTLFFLRGVFQEFTGRALAATNRRLTTIFGLNNPFL